MSREEIIRWLTDMKKCDKIEYINHSIDNLIIKLEQQQPSLEHRVEKIEFFIGDFIKP